MFNVLSERNDTGVLDAQRPCWLRRVEASWAWPPSDVGCIRAVAESEPARCYPIRRFGLRARWRRGRRCRPPTRDRARCKESPCRSLRFKSRNKRQNLRLRDHVERARGLVSDQQCGAMHNCHGDQNALCLSDAHLRRIFAQEFVGSRASSRFRALRLMARSQSDRDPEAWARQDSASWVRILSAGLSDDSGLCNTSAIFRPRRLRRSRSGRFSSSQPSNSIVPSACVLLRSSRPSMASARVLLPDPLCPISPRTSPRRICSATFAQHGRLVAVAHGNMRREAERRLAYSLLQIRESA